MQLLSFISFLYFFPPHERDQRLSKKKKVYSVQCFPRDSVVAAEMSLTCKTFVCTSAKCDVRKVSVGLPELMACDEPNVVLKEKCVILPPRDLDLLDFTNKLLFYT